MALRKKECPKCAERIRANAVVCRYCGWQLLEQTGQEAGTLAPSIEDTQHDTTPRRGRRTATAALIVAVLTLAGAAVLGFLYYTERNDHAAVSQELESNQAELAKTREALANAQEELAAAHDAGQKLAAEAYDRGYNLGFKEGQALAESLPSYDEGFRDGYKDAFCCFDGGWNTGKWYLVKIGDYPGRPRLKWKIEARYEDLRDCQIMFLDGDALYTRNEYGC